MLIVQKNDTYIKFSQLFIFYPFESVMTVNFAVTFKYLHYHFIAKDWIAKSYIKLVSKIPTEHSFRKPLSRLHVQLISRLSFHPSVNRPCFCCSAKEIKASGPRIGHKVKKVVKHSTKLNGLVAGNHANGRTATASLPTFPGRPHHNGSAAPPSKPVSINKPAGPAHDTQRGQPGNRCSNGNHGNQAKVSPNRSHDNELNGPIIGSKNGGNTSKMPSDAAHGNQLTNRSNGYRGNPLKAKLDHGNGKSSPSLNGVNRHGSSVLNVPYR